MYQEVQLNVIMGYVIISFLDIKYFELGLDISTKTTTKTDITMHPYLTIRVISLVKYHLLTNMQFKFLEQSFQLIKKITNFQGNSYSTCRSVICQVKYFYVLRF